MDLIAAQHQMTASKSAASLLAAGVEVHDPFPRTVRLSLTHQLQAFLKQVTVHALAATSSNHPFASISPADESPQRPLAPSSFSTLFAIAPFEIPMPTATVTDLMTLDKDAGEDEEEEDEYTRVVQKLDPTNRQIVQTLLSHSGVRAMLQPEPSRARKLLTL